MSPQLNFLLSLTPILIGILIIVLLITLVPRNNTNNNKQTKENPDLQSLPPPLNSEITRIKLFVSNQNHPTSEYEKHLDQLYTEYYQATLDPKRFQIIDSSQSEYDIALLFNNAMPANLTLNPSHTVALCHEPSGIRHISEELQTFTQQKIGHFLLSGKDTQNPFENRFPFVISQPINISNTIPQKSKIMSLLVTDKKTTENHKYRYSLAELILDLDLDIDIYGKGADYFRSLEAYQDKPQLKGHYDDPATLFKDYQYTIAIENTVEPHYITEKFINAILYHTVPIYLGAPNISDYFGLAPNCIRLTGQLSQDIQTIQNILTSPQDFLLNLFSSQAALQPYGKANLQTYLQSHLFRTNWNQELSYRNSQLSSVKLPSRILIGGIAKNIASNIPTLKRVIQVLIDTFDMVECYIFENNSTDDTPELLQAWQKEDPSHIFVKTLVLTREEQMNMVLARTWDDKPCRIELISWARNQLLDMMQPHTKQDQFDYVLMLDLDIGNVDLHTLIQTIRFFPRDDADVLFANGMDESGAQERGNYYDFFALRMANYPYGQEISKSALDRIPEFELILKPTQPYFPVYSAFGGLAIYKIDTFQTNPRYTPYPNQALTELYDELLSKYPNHPLISEVQKDEQGHAKFIPCCGYYQCSIVCEHVTFHATLRQQGKTKMFIVPELIYVVAGSH